MSIQTKEVPAALSALLKAKGNNFSKDIAIAQQPVAVIVEGSNTEVTATPEPNPEIETAKAESAPATSTSEPERDDGRDSPAYRELKQHYDKTVYELRTKVKQLEDQAVSAARAAVKPPKTPEEMKAFKEQYGEAFDFIKTIVMEELQNDTFNVDLRNQVEEAKRLAQELKEKEAFKKILEEHPDADEIKRSPQFAKWFNEQPDDIKNILAHSQDVRAVNKQLTLYKLEVLGINPKEKKKAETKANVDASVGISVTSQPQVAVGKKRWTGTEIQQISSNYNLWRKYSTEIDQARRENRVDWDK